MISAELSENDAGTRKYFTLKLELTLFETRKKLQMEDPLVIKLRRMLVPMWLTLAILNATPQVASAYQIDCAILLCLAGDRKSVV